MSRCSSGAVGQCGSGAWGRYCKDMRDAEGDTVEVTEGETLTDFVSR